MSQRDKNFPSKKIPVNLLCNHSQPKKTWIFQKKWISPLYVSTRLMCQNIQWEDPTCNNRYHINHPVSRCVWGFLRPTWAKASKFIWWRYINGELHTNTSNIILFNIILFNIPSHDRYVLKNMPYFISVLRAYAAWYQRLLSNLYNLNWSRFLSARYNKCIKVYLDFVCPNSSNILFRASYILLYVHGSIFQGPL